MSAFPWRWEVVEQAEVGKDGTPPLYAGGLQVCTTAALHGHQYSASFQRRQ